MSSSMGLVKFITTLSQTGVVFWGTFLRKIQISEKNFKESSLCNNLTRRPCAVLKFPFTVGELMQVNPNNSLAEYVNF